MTIIAWDGKKLAADRALNFGSSKATCTKIFKVDQALIGWSGVSSVGLEMVQWFKNGRKIEDFPDSQRKEESGSLLVIEHDIRNKIVIREYYSCPFPMKIEDSFYATGSGAEFALATMYLGYPAEKAIEVATALCPTCGNGIDILEF